VDILSYPVGLVVGLFSIWISLGPQASPADLLLDGQVVCHVTSQSPSCVVDFGSRVRLHVLELIRTDATGAVTERTVRWVNRPGERAELNAAARCNDHDRRCAIQLSWAHPAKLDPIQISIALDGKHVRNTTTRELTVPFPATGAPEVLVAEARFPDGARASVTRLLRGSYPAETQTSLQAIPLDIGISVRSPGLVPGDPPGSPVKALELGDDAVGFVLEPHAFDAVRDLERSTLQPAKRISAPLEAVDRLQATVGNELLAASDIKGPIRERSRWLRTLISIGQDTKFRFLRMADAVAATGHALAARPQRRFLVIVLTSLGDRLPDESVLTPADAIAYLRQVHVPFVVWRVAGAAAARWPSGRRLEVASDVPLLATEIRHALDGQRVGWIDGREDPRSLVAPLPQGLRLAGSEREPDH
jgi:hypothetical protein